MFPLTPHLAFAHGAIDDTIRNGPPRSSRSRRRDGRRDVPMAMNSAMEANCSDDASPGADRPEGVGPEGRSGDSERGRGRGPGRGRGRGSGRGRGGGWDARGGRARRGDVRAAILALLAEEPRHGYDLIRQITSRTGGSWRPSPGSVYPTLAQLEDEGLVVASEVDAKRVFALTDEGRVESERRDGPPPWDEVNDDVAATGGGRGDESLSAQVPKLMAAIKPFRHGANVEQRRAAARLLADTRRRLYLILADEPVSPSDPSVAVPDGASDGASADERAIDAQSAGDQSDGA